MCLVFEGGDVIYVPLTVVVPHHPVFEFSLDMLFEGRCGAPDVLVVCYLCALFQSVVQSLSGFGGLRWAQMNMAW